MTLFEVLNTLKGHPGYWFRPVSWIGSGRAYAYWNGMTALVPDPEGPKQGMTCDPRELVGEWEITNAMTVCEEREQPNTPMRGDQNARSDSGLRPAEEPLATIENGAGPDELRAALRSMPDEVLIAQSLVQQGAVHALSWLISNGCTEQQACAMLASLRTNADLIRREAARRGKPDLFSADQTTFS